MRSPTHSVAEHMRHAIVLAGISLALSSPLVAGIDIPDLPLEVGSAVPSNLMFILDDSGSMQCPSLTVPRHISDLPPAMAQV